MCWRKCDLWKAGIAIAGMLLLLVLMAWIPVSAADAGVRAMGPAQPVIVTVQATPTEDATVTALSKEQLTLQVKQLQNQLQNQNNWLANNSTALIAAVATVVVALFGILQWAITVRQAQDKDLRDREDERRKEKDAQDKELADRKAERERRDEEQKRWLKDQEAEREKRAEERFQSAVEGLGSEREEAKVGAAILLRTFLRPGYQQFYTQTFDLAVAHLRLPRTANPPGDPNAPLPLTTLSQALIVAFKESFPLARDRLKVGNSQFNPQSLDASYTQLDKANLNYADLEQAWMIEASLREANLAGANLTGANLGGANLSRVNLFKAKLNSNETSLYRANLSGATLIKAKLNGTSLYEANLSGAYLNGADLSGADLSEAYVIGVDLSRVNLSRANLSRANLSRANLSEAKLMVADLNEANLRGADLNGADLGGTDLGGADLSRANLSGANIEDARSLKDTDLRGVEGLTKEQLEACKAQGAIIDEDARASSPQPTVAPALSPQSKDVQTPPAPAAQGGTPAPETDENSTPSSKSGPES